MGRAEGRLVIKAIENVIKQPIAATVGITLHKS